MTKILFTSNPTFKNENWAKGYPRNIRTTWDSAPDFPWLSVLSQKSPKGNVSNFYSAIQLTESNALVTYDREGDDEFLADWAVRDSKGILRKKVTLQLNVQGELESAVIDSRGSLHLLFRGSNDILISYNLDGKEVNRRASPAGTRYKEILIDKANNIYLTGENVYPGKSSNYPFLEKLSSIDLRQLWISAPVKTLELANYGNGYSNVGLSKKSVVFLSDGTVLQAISGHLNESGGSEGPGLYLLRINGENGLLQDMVKIDDDASYSANALIVHDGSVVLKTEFGIYDIQLDAKPIGLGAGTATQSPIQDDLIPPTQIIFKGSKSADTLTGNSVDNTISGLGGADTLTGAGGADTFKYALKDSLLSGCDRITDLAIGTDKMDGPKVVSAANLKELGVVASLDKSGIAAVLTSANFTANGAATFSYVSGSTNRTFLALNDSKAGFQSNKDAIIEITGFTGNLTELAIV